MVREVAAWGSKLTLREPSGPQTLQKAARVPQAILRVAGQHLAKSSYSPQVGKSYSSLNPSTLTCSSAPPA